MVGISHLTKDSREAFGRVGSSLAGVSRVRNYDTVPDSASSGVAELVIAPAPNKGRGGSALRVGGCELGALVGSSGSIVWRVVLIVNKDWHRAMVTQSTRAGCSKACTYTTRDVSIRPRR